MSGNHNSKVARQKIIRGRWTFKTRKTLVGKVEGRIKICTCLFIWPQNHEFIYSPKLYTQSTLNIDLILWHTQLNVCA